MGEKKLSPLKNNHKIAIDAMGGDHAPDNVVAGAVEAVKEYDSRLILVGKEDVIKKELTKYSFNGSNIEIRHAQSIVEMDESPSMALRRKKDSSIRVANELVKEGETKAVISAGNTGAAMAFSKIVLGSLRGIERPAIAALSPSKTGITLLLDVGANVDCSARQLSQFAIMGSVYADDIMGIRNPRVGLLNIGTEEIKGGELTKEAYGLLKKLKLNFIGNVEGRDIYNGTVDVVVCDGFIGNVGLKISEGVADTITYFLKEEINKGLLGKLGFLLLRSSLKGIRKKIDYSEYGGAPLLGVNGISIICHGGSSAKAIKNAIRVAHECVSHKLNEHLLRNIERAL
ncbi:MAG: phosphate acyltransferase PlsX [bacterium]